MSASPLDPQMLAQVAKAASILRTAKHVVVTTGAGVSAESGVPTFRDALTGLWAQYDPEELATPQAFARDPKLVWDWYEFRRTMVRAAKPNPAHLAIAQLKELVPKLTLVTQNVDDLHEQAGSSGVLHLHGNLAASECVAACHGKPTPIDLSQLPPHDAAAGPPTCPHCGAHARPSVVWFGESLPQDALEEAFEVSERCDVMFVVGTSGIVMPAARLPMMAAANGAKVIEFNPNDSPITNIADVKVSAPAGVSLPLVLDAISALPEEDRSS